MRFRPRPNNEEVQGAPNTILGVGSSMRGTLMVQGTLRIDGEFEGDILNCERIEIGEHGLMRADVEVKEALVEGRVMGNIRALGTVQMRSGAQVHGDVSAMSVTIEPGAYFNGHCSMLESGPETLAVGAAADREGHFLGRD